MDKKLFENLGFFQQKKLWNLKYLRTREGSFLEVFSMSPVLHPQHEQFSFEK